MSFWTSGRSKSGLRSWLVDQLMQLPIKVSGTVANVRFDAMLAGRQSSFGAVGSGGVAVSSNTEPHHGCGSLTTGGPGVVAVPE